MRAWTIKDMDWKRKLKLRDIRDTLYFKPCNFTLNTLEDFVLTYRNKKTNVDTPINFLNSVCYKQVQKSHLNIFLEFRTLLSTTLAILQSVSENH